MAGDYERRREERRSGEDRRATHRADPLPRRSQLRRESDVLAHLTAAVEKDQALTKPQCLDATPLCFQAPEHPTFQAPALKEKHNFADR